MIQTAHEYLKKRKDDIKKKFDLDLEFELRFDLKGYSTLGQCKMLRYNSFLIRLHVKLLERYGRVYLEDVLTHEVAHSVQFALYRNKTKAHGREWKGIMSKLEEKPYEKKSRPKYDTMPYRNKRIYKKFKYNCLCENFTHHLTSITHNRIKRKTHFYTCKRCNAPLIYKAENE